MNRWIPTQRRAALYLLLAWLIALMCPVAIMGQSQRSSVFYGWVVLASGMLGLLTLQFGWFANPLFFLALSKLVFPSGKAFWQKKAQNQVLFVAIIICLVDSATWNKMYGDNGSAPIQSFGFGYYLWFLTMIGSAAALIYYSRTPRVSHV